MMKTIIKLGEAPTTPEALTPAELAQIRNLIVGWIGAGNPELTLEELFDLFDDTFSESCTF